MADRTIVTAEAEAYLSEGNSGDGARRFASAEPVDVAVDGGTIRVYRVPAAVGSGDAGRRAPRPVIFVSGWGTIPESFSDFYSAVDDEVPVYHVESREKSSSRISRRTGVFTMDQFARDIARVIEQLEIAHRDPVLMGTCFGSAVIVHGLAAGYFTAPTVVCVDPMDRLWMPRWIIRFIGPILPAFGLWLIRPILRAIVLGGMKETVQRQRAKDFINSAHVWKWRKAAIQVGDWNIFDHTARVPVPVNVLNGSHDRFHNSDTFPHVAGSIPGGVLLRIPVGEARRERLMGATASRFACSDPDGGIPERLRPFAKHDQTETNRPNVSN